MAELPLLPAGGQGPELPRFDLHGGFFQGARMVDVFLLGPFMVWFAVRSTQAPDWARFVLGVSGLMTMGFNLRNYALVDRVRTQRQDCCEALLRMT